MQWNVRERLRSCRGSIEQLADDLTVNFITMQIPP